MNERAAIGKWILIFAVICSLVIEVSLLVLNMVLVDRFKVTQIYRILFALWLYRQVWDGASWARWLVGVLHWAGALFAFTIGLDSPKIQANPLAETIVIVFGIIYLFIGFGFISSWMKAFQKHQRSQSL